MRVTYLWSLGLALALIGCGGGASDAPVPADPELTKQWGPDVMPDPDAEPLEFLYWRVDQMFEQTDGNADGRITAEEFPGADHNFNRIDTNSDGIITKKEVIDDQVERLREEGKIP